jgi:uncharacterized protein (TIGR03437 family)
VVTVNQTMNTPYLFLISLALSGQTQPQVVGSGYLLPAAIYAAPGQLVTLIVQGFGSTVVQVVKASPSANLPTTLGGISVGYWQGTGSLAPILQVQPVSSCPGNTFPSFCNEAAAVTVQIPFEAQPLLPGPCNACPGIPTGQVNVLLAGEPNGNSFFSYPLADQIHVLTSCDAFITAPATVLLPTGFPCPQIVAHADGSMVSAASPARAGEELVAYAVGLGQTNPASVTGQLVTKSAPTVITYSLDYNYHPNALPSRPLPAGPQPIFAGTTPGYVGLYQINFVVPPVPAGTPACVDASAMPLGSNVVQSNLTVSIGGTYSFDGARICVATQ